MSKACLACFENDNRYHESWGFCKYYNKQVVFNKSMRKLLETDGAVYKAFRRAIERSKV